MHSNVTFGTAPCKLTIVLPWQIIRAETQKVCLFSLHVLVFTQMFWGSAAVGCELNPQSWDRHSADSGAGPVQPCGKPALNLGSWLCQNQEVHHSEHPRLLLATLIAVRTVNHWPCDLASYHFVFCPFPARFHSEDRNCVRLIHWVCPCPSLTGLLLLTHGMCTPLWLRSHLSPPSLQFSVAVKDGTEVYWGHQLIFVMKGTVTDATLLCSSCFPLPFC